MSKEEKQQQQPQQEQQQPTTSDYWIGPVIGEGSFAQVFYGQHKLTGRKVAIKVLEQATCQKQPQVLQGLLTERRLLQELQSSPFVVNLWASFLDSQCVYLVMELILGGDLQTLIQRGHENDNNQQQGEIKGEGSWKLISIPFYAKQLIESIQFIHSKGVVHADLKPQNILCHLDGKLCLADFASAFELDNKIPTSLSTTMLSSNKKNVIPVPRGTSQYASPEIIRALPKESLTVAVDLWSLGCILYCMFVGRSPFETESEALTIQAVVDYEKTSQRQEAAGSFNNNNKDNSAMKDNLKYHMNFAATESEKWEKTITGLLDINPLERIKTFQEFLSEDICSQSTDAGNNETTDSSSHRLVLPSPSWENIVSETRLRDGALGWGVFML